MFLKTYCVYGAVFWKLSLFTQSQRTTKTVFNADFVSLTQHIYMDSNNKRQESRKPIIIYITNYIVYNNYIMQVFSLAQKKSSFVWCLMS